MVVEEPAADSPAPAHLLAVSEHAAVEKRKRRGRGRGGEEDAHLGTVMTRIELSALPEIKTVPEGLKRRDVTGKSCAWRIVRIGCECRESNQNQTGGEGKRERSAPSAS